VSAWQKNTTSHPCRGGSLPDVVHALPAMRSELLQRDATHVDDIADSELSSVGQYRDSASLHGRARTARPLDRPVPEYVRRRGDLRTRCPSAEAAGTGLPHGSILQRDGLSVPTHEALIPLSSRRAPPACR
jgi:hypothetical protein